MPDTEGSKRLFSGLRFFCNREVPLDWLQICILSLGGQVGWAGETSPYSESDSSITHHVVDRPMPEKSIKKGREYVQPQWLFDSINAQIRLPVSKYQPGSQLPPHLSPFVDDNEGYVPKYREEIQKLQAAAGLGGVQGKISTSKVAKEELGDGDEDEDDDFDEQDEENAAQIRSKNGGNSDKASVSKRSRDYKEDEEESNDGGEFDEESSEPESEVEDVVLETNTKRSKGSKGIVYESNDKKMTEVRILVFFLSLFTLLYFLQLHSIKGRHFSYEPPKGVLVHELSLGFDDGIFLR
jgi:pescadillo protein